ncbi:recombinase family protein [Aeromonas hydrophila]|uniref:recombinase family protein n=1 Tax=Aeromonas hydrophila TaxID=644 RepID=UPI003D2475E2
MGREKHATLKSTAYSYIRLSSRQQILGDGQRRQLEAALTYCRDNNLTLSQKTFKDLGVSAYKEVDRPSLSDLHQCIANGTIKAGDVIILEKLDRLSRKGISATQRMLQEILNQGVEVVSLMDGMRLDRNSLDDLTSVIRIAIAADLANQESSTKSKRVQANKDQMRERIKAGIPIPQKLPFWLSFVDGKYVFNEKQQILERIIELKKSGTSLMKIAGILNEEKIKSPNVRGIWSPSTLRDVLRNPILYGAHQLTVKVKGKYIPSELVKDYYPAVMTYSEFTQLNNKAIVRPAGTSETNHISGLVYCGVCGNKMSNKSRATSKGKVNYYYCRQSMVKACGFRTHIRDLHKMVIKNISHLTVTKPTQSVDINSLLLELDQVESRVKDLTAEFSNLNSALPVSAISAAISSMEERKKELNAKIREASTIEPDALQSVMKHVDDPKKFNIDLKKIIKRIEVSPYGEHQKIKVIRFDNHSIMWRTGGWIKGVSDTEKTLNMVMELLEGVEE